jgi:hypothetical protein
MGFNSAFKGLNYIGQDGNMYIVYKLLTYRYLNNLNQLGRFCNLYLKTIESHSHISIQVQGCSVSYLYF